MAGISSQGHISFDEIADDLAAHRDGLDVYARTLAFLNRSARLTGPRNPDAIWKEHILDCAFSLPFAPEIGRAVDVGSGGGLPGVVWAVCRPHLTVVLLESVRKKCSALDEIVRVLGLGNVIVECARSEQFATRSRESFTVAVSRAVGHLGVVAEYMSPLVAPGGRLLCFKGPKVRDEIGEIGAQWEVLGLDTPVLRPYGHGGRDLFLALWKKTGHCPDRFPRRPGRAQKQHWWR